MSNYDQLYTESIKSPRKFWSNMAAKTLKWDVPFTEDNIMEQCDMNKGEIHFFDGKLNASGEPLYML